MKFVDILARELAEWPSSATHAVITEAKARSSEVLGICFTESGPPVWHCDHWTIIGSGCGEDVYWLTEHDIKNSFGCEQSEENIVSQAEWQSARAAYLASIQPARDPEIAAVVDKPANPWRRNRGRKTPPVEDGVRIEVKMRNGEVFRLTNASMYRWKHANMPGDLMQWRYAEPQHAQPKQMAQTIEQVIDNAESAASAAFNPIALRDEYNRITLEWEELNKQMSTLTGRMGQIVSALRAEGFALVAIDQSNR